MFRSAPAADPPRPSDSVAEVSELRLAVGDIEAAVTFYTRVLGLDVRDRAAGLARFATGTVDLTVEQRDAALDGRPVRYDTYLLVFHAAPIQAARDRLQQRGLVFKSRGIGVSDIGATARFFDPWGHPFCLYEPSDESLAWGSGAKVKSLVASAGGEAGVSRFARRDDEDVLSEGTWGPWIT
jgi:catechol 2,3-dioxygenase-like lactoylglutathione lyase family enzyme